MKTYEEATGQFSEFWQGVLAITCGVILGLFLAALGLVNAL